MPQPDSARVVVTGMGICSPIGNDVETALQSLRIGRSGIRPVPEWDAHQDLGPRVAGRVEGLDIKALIPRKYRRTMGKVAGYAVYATRQAVAQAGLDKNLLGSGRVGIAVGSTVGSPSSTHEYYANILNIGVKGNKGTAFLRVMSHTCAANVALAFGITGRVWGPNSACTSASQAIGLAYDTLRLGEQDIMLCGGAEEAHFTTAGTFDLVSAASTSFNDSPEKTPRPFDQDRDGMVVGEGSGILALERYEHARARGAEVLGEVMGFATTCDGLHITTPAAAGMRRCMEAGLKSAGLKPSQIEYINGHATGTETGDPTEAVATAEVFGDRVPLASTKGYTGHTLGACGAIESIFILGMMREGFLAPNFNLDRVDPACQGPWLLTELREQKLGLAMNNNFAFGGINTSLVYRAP